MQPRFGTDGLRGVADSELTPELVTSLGRAAARHLVSSEFLIGSDTRLSSPTLKRVLAAGIASQGVDVVDVGVIPTPGLAWLAASRRVPAAMISASHNPYYDNGIKLLSSSGSKIPDDTERAIERELDAIVASIGAQKDGDEGADWRSDTVGDVGTVREDHAALGGYIDHLVACAKPDFGPSLFVVCDCANGAASAIARKVFERIGAKVLTIAAEPNGRNINDHCGSTYPDHVARSVVEHGADLGLSFDGDADRLIAVGHDGSVIDGDHLLALFALDLAERGSLDNSGVVLTVMSNLGLRRRLEQSGIAVVETPVGDRYVSDALEENAYVLGGEQSGHIVFRSEATTGDGMLTGIKLLELIARSGRPLTDLAFEAMTRVPQELRTIPVAEPSRLDDSSVIWSEVDRAMRELGGSGRVLLRRSGTESAVRVMVEAENPDQARAIVEHLADLVGRELGERATQA